MQISRLANSFPVDFTVMCAISFVDFTTPITSIIKCFFYKNR